MKKNELFSFFLLQNQKKRIYLQRQNEKTTLTKRRFFHQKGAKKHMRE